MIFNKLRSQVYNKHKGMTSLHEYFTTVIYLAKEGMSDDLQMNTHLNELITVAYEGLLTDSFVIQRNTYNTLIIHADLLFGEFI